MRRTIRDNKVNVLSYAALFGALAVLLAWKLNTLVPGYSADEVATYNAAMNVRGLLDNPLNAPYLLAVKALSLLHPDSYLPLRIVSVIFAFGVLGSFARLVHSWQDMRTAIVGTLLFGSSAWFLHIARLGTPEVLSLGVFVVIANGFWAKQSSHWLPLALLFLGVAVCMYMPGMIWFVLFGVMWQWRTIDRLFKTHLVTVTLAGLVMLAIIAPLAWALYRHHDLILPYLGLPSHVPDPLQVLRNIAVFPYHLLVHGKENPALWLGKAPLLDAFSTAMFALGSYIYLRQFRLGRTPVFVSVIGLTLLLSSVAHYVSFNIIVPFVFVLIAIGTAYMFDTWFMTFPRNPIARPIGWLLLGSVLAIACFYNLTHYYVGWPSAKATYRVYSFARKP